MQQLMQLVDQPWKILITRRAQIYPRREQIYGLPMDIKNYDPINAQLSIHMDVLNIFTQMAMIMSDGGRRK
ncbi:hypothetical protein Q1695_014843 [Nippostrongylus brasiliensis]|nr:hypothetical protein Q1695_014843 [Nippostrongylus brasiliensis]